MEKCAIIIGINDTPGLPYLASPCNYARKMEQWAKSQEFETSLFVDETETGEKVQVRVEAIMTAVRELLRGNPSQLLVYFSGHGLELNPGNDLWLLPEYAEWPNQAIDMAMNKHLAIESGADHIVFISDACRTPGNGGETRHVLGSPIFPSLHRKNYDVVIDTLFSTWPGEASIDYRDENGHYKSMYSDCLLECLQGHVKEVIREIENPENDTTFPAVICHDLSKYLKRIVPIVMAQKTMQSQHPNSNISSTVPIYISKFHPDESVTDDFMIEETSLEQVDHPSQYNETIHNKLNKVSKWRSKKPFKLGINSTVKLIDLVNRTMVNEYSLPRDRTGIIIHGNNSPSIYEISGTRINFENRINELDVINFIDFPLQGRDLSTILVSNPSRTGFYPVTLLPNFINSLIFNRGELINIDYIPTIGYRRDEAIRNRIEVAKRKAEIVTAAKNGIFQGTEELGSYIRRYKSLDPTLGLFAAYAYFQNGKFEDVRSVFRYMEGEYEPVLPEVNLLTYLSGDNRADRLLQYNVPILPMLTQGWSYLSLVDHLHQRELKPFLRPGLWTSFSRQGLERLIPLFDKLR